MKSFISKVFLIFMVLTMLFVFPVCAKSEDTIPPSERTSIELPPPSHDGEVSVERALESRRSIRSYKDEPLSIEEISQLLWSAQGITDQRGFRTAPSAGATYPLEIYLVVDKGTDEIPAGIYHYHPTPHSIELVKTGQHGSALSSAALSQGSVSAAPVNIVITAFFERTARRYRDRAPRYVHMEVGAVGQNIHMQCESLGLGTVFIGAFTDNQVSNILGLDSDCEPLLIMPIGKVN